VAEIDFEAEGLLEGLDGNAREARLELLRALAADGVSLEELRQAVEEDRLVLLPVERALGDDYRFTLEDVAEQAELPAELLRKQMQALGLPVPQPGERILGERDLDAARRVKTVRDVGLPDEGILEVARVIGNSMARLAAAAMAVIGETFIRPGDTERDLGLRYAGVAKELVPELGRTLQFVLERHLHELVRQAVVSQAELASGQLPGATEIAVAFADLVGFTRLGERADVGEIGQVTGRLTELATASAQPPVRLVKTIGDAAMLASTDPARLLDSVLGLVDAVEQDEQLPSVRAGGAWGPALSRAGDWYGRPVNLASRITDAARPGSVLVADELAKQAERAGDGFRFSRAGSRHFKGIKGNVRLSRVRRADDET
jgi:adenylate cyclase